MSQPKSEKRRRALTLAALGFGYFIDNGEEQSMGVLYPAIKLLWGLSNFELGLLGTMRAAIAAIAAPFWGYAADRWSRKNVLFFGTGIWGIWNSPMFLFGPCAGRTSPSNIPKAFTPCRALHLKTPCRSGWKVCRNACF